jgi:hypothetical protein
MAAASDYHAARPAFQSINEPSADSARLWTAVPGEDPRRARLIPGPDKRSRLF